jgi:transcription elongation GreA/GreB family factor
MPLDPHDDKLAERGRALIAAAVADTRAPLALRERIEADRVRVVGGARRRRLRVLLAPAVGLAAALAVALVVLIGGGASPSVLATASLAARGPILPAPHEDPSNHALLKASVDGVPFPYWSDSFQWKAVGARTDKISGRMATTVYYENANGVRAAYTIVGGSTIDPPSGARKVTDNGITLWVTQDKGRRVLTWLRGGHTCVMSAPSSFPQALLVDLASWKGKGKVPF